MKLIKTVKKIMALGTGAAMIGATISASAFAADLADYPSPFVKDGKFNGVIVVGDDAKSADVLGSVDIATSLQFASRVKKSVTSAAGGQVSVSGEAWRVGTSSKKLEFSESLSAGTASAKQETIRNITSFITNDELPNLLADGTFRNTKGDFDYHQYLYFDNVNQQTGTNDASLSVVYSEDPDTDVTGDYFYVKNNDRIARYGLEFTSSAESSITDSAGTASSTGTFYWDYEGKDIEMLSQTFSIVKARRPSAANVNGIELTLMGGAQRDTLDEGESKTYTVNGKEFDVSLEFVGSTTAKFVVNGEPTDSLQEGGTYTLSDDSQIGVKDISSQEFAGGVRKVEFFVGANKVFLKDTDVSNDGDGAQTLEVGNAKLSDTKVTISGSNDNTTFKIDKIQLNISADDDIYVPVGGKLSEQMEKPDALLSAWDITYNGLEKVPTETIKIGTSGSNQYELSFVDGDGNIAKIPLVYTSSGTNLKLGDNDDDLIIGESNYTTNGASTTDGIQNSSSVISRNDYFVVTDISQKQGERSTYALRYKGASAITDSSPVITFQNVGSGVTFERPLTAGGTHPFNGASMANIQLGGATFAVYNASGTDSDDFDIQVDLNGNGQLDLVNGNDVSVSTGGQANVVNLTTKGGAQILLKTGPLNASSGPAQAPTMVNVSFQTVDTDDYDNVAPSAVDFQLDAASGKVQASEDTLSTNHNYRSPQGETNTNYAYTSLGAFVKWDNPTNDPDKIDIIYPTVQRLPMVFVTAPGAEISTGEATEAGNIVYYDTTPIAVGSAKLASEVTDVEAQNVIAVGGPCANAVAAELAGNPADCAAGYTAGKGVVSLVEHANGNVGMTVAGYSADDTRRAARVVAKYQEWQDAGKLAGLKVEVSGTSFTDISVAAPAPKVEAPAEEAAMEEEAKEEEAAPATE